MSQQYDDATLVAYAQELQNSINNGNEEHAVWYANALAENMVCIEVEVTDVQQPTPPPQPQQVFRPNLAAAGTVYQPNHTLFTNPTIQQGYGLPAQNNINLPPNPINRQIVNQGLNPAKNFNMNLSPNTTGVYNIKNPPIVSNPPQTGPIIYQRQRTDNLPPTQMHPINQNINYAQMGSINQYPPAIPANVNPINPNIAYGANPNNFANPVHNTMILNPNLPTVNQPGNSANNYYQISAPPANIYAAPNNVPSANQTYYYNQYGNN